MSEARAHSGNELRAIVLLIYGLFVFATFNGATAIIGVVLAYIKRDAARGTIWEGHIRNVIALFWVGLFIVMIALILLLQAFGGLAVSLIATNGNPSASVIGWLLALLPAFWICAVIFVVWYFYRTLRGLIRAIEAKPY